MCTLLQQLDFQLLWFVITYHYQQKSGGPISWVRMDIFVHSSSNSQSNVALSSGGRSGSLLLMSGSSSSLSLSFVAVSSCRCCRRNWFEGKSYSLPSCSGLLQVVGCCCFAWLWSGLAGFDYCRRLPAGCILAWRFSGPGELVAGSSSLSLITIVIFPHVGEDSVVASVTSIIHLNLSL